MVLVRIGLFRLVQHVLTYPLTDRLDSSDYLANILSAKLPLDYNSITVTSRPFRGEIWTTIATIPLITGSGSFDIALTANSAATFSLVSRESGVNAPQLVIETIP